MRVVYTTYSYRAERRESGEDHEEEAYLRAVDETDEKWPCLAERQAVI